MRVRKDNLLRLLVVTAIVLLGGIFVFVRQSNAPSDDSIVSDVENAIEVPSANVATVKFVIDGDTLDILGGERIRLIGMDTPEDGEPFYEEARSILQELVLGKSVRLVSDVSESDKYNRLLRYVYIDTEVGEVFVNEYLVREGYAVQFPYGPDRKYQELFSEAEADAKVNRRGMWGIETVD